MAAEFKMPDVSVGDMVLFHDNPFSPQGGSMGWVSSKPGTQTVKLLVYAEEAGFVEKPSVRHISDPFWKESETAQAWGRWGCFSVHPSTQMLKELRDILTKAKLDKARSGGKDGEK